MNVCKFIEKYKSDNFESYLKEGASISYWNNLIKTYEIERLYFTGLDLISLKLNNELKEGKVITGASFDGFCERQIRIIEINTIYSNLNYEECILENEEDDIGKYRKSYSRYFLEDFAYKQNENKSINSLYKGNYFADWMLRTNVTLYENKFSEKCNVLLSGYNKRLYFLANHIILLFKSVNGYEKSNDRSFLTSIKTNEDKVLHYVNTIEYFSEIVRVYVERKEFQNAIDIKNYCLRVFKNCIKNLKDVFKIDVYNSPLGDDFQNVKKAFEASINLDELKLITELKKNDYNALGNNNIIKQSEVIKIDEFSEMCPEHNPNDWNGECFRLFKYLIDNYFFDKKKTNTKLICIWFYLAEYNPDKYELKLTKKNYKKFIFDSYGIKITNSDKPYNYESKVFNTLNEHRINFEASF